MTMTDSPRRVPHAPDTVPENDTDLHDDAVEATFAELGLPDALCKVLTRRKITSPFPIQAAVIPDVLAGRDVCGRAPTGSGKTLAFGLPMIARLRDARPASPVALILAPTRELAEQISTELSPLAEALGHRIATVYGGVGYGGQRKALDRGAEVVVACPGRLEDLISMGAVRLGDVETVVIDEADRMADMGFLPAVRRIVDATSTRANGDRQVLLFSATLEGPVASLVSEYQTDPARHEVGDRGPDITSARHLFWMVDRMERTRHIADIVNALGSSVVFTRTRHGADRLAKQLDRIGIAAEPIHGGRSQSQRDRALEAFKRGRASALIATDVAARGVHVDGVASVIHFDPPADASTYLHRSGRTARAGATGVVVSLVDQSMRKATKQLQREVGLDAQIAPPDLAALGEVAERVAPPDVDESGGIVKFFNPGKGYGFITQTTGGDVFVHFSNIAVEGYKTLEEGQRVQYEVRTGRRGLEAFDVVPV